MVTCIARHAELAATDTAVQALRAMRNRFMASPPLSSDGVHGHPNRDRVCQEFGGRELIDSGGLIRSVIHDRENASAESRRVAPGGDLRLGIVVVSDDAKMMADLVLRSIAARVLDRRLVRSKGAFDV